MRSRCTMAASWKKLSASAVDASLTKIRELGDVAVTSTLGRILGGANPLCSFGAQVRTPPLREYFHMRSSPRMAWHGFAPLIDGVSVSMGGSGEGGGRQSSWDAKAGASFDP